MSARRWSFFLQLQVRACLLECSRCFQRERAEERAALAAAAAPAAEESELWSRPSAAAAAALSVTLAAAHIASSLFKCAAAVVAVLTRWLGCVCLCGLQSSVALCCLRCLPLLLLSPLLLSHACRRMSSVSHPSGGSHSYSDWTKEGVNPESVGGAQQRSSGVAAAAAAALQ